MTLPVARIAHLIAMKILSRDDDRRPQDLVDLRALLRSAGPGDLDDARRLLVLIADRDLIADRGYHRGRDLVWEMSRLRLQP